MTFLTQRSSWSSACLRHHAERHFQPLGEESIYLCNGHTCLCTFTFLLPHTPFHTDHMAGGCQAAQQQQHGDHAHRQQKVRRTFPLLHVSFVANGTPTIDCEPAVIWKHAEMSSGRKAKHLQENTVSSSWRHRPRLQPMWRRPSSTQPGRSTTRSRRASSTSTMRRTGSSWVPSTALLEGQLPVKGVSLGVRGVAVEQLLLVHKWRPWPACGRQQSCFSCCGSWRHQALSVCL